MKIVKWLYPGMRVKRWLFLAFLGAMIVGAGLAISDEFKLLDYINGLIKGITQTLFGLQSTILGGLIVTFLGISMMVIGIRRTVNSILGVVVPHNEQKLVDIIYQKRHLKRGPKVVVIGGGTGLSVLLRGLKNYTSNITAIVTVADDGGSSGRLRGDLGILPPGDIRNCLVALADTEVLMEELFQHRFTDGSELSGHNLGNLLIAAMTEIAGDFEQAIHQLSKVLAIRGRVLPSTLTEVVLMAETKDGQIIVGESNIPAAGKRIKRVFIDPPDCRPVDEAIRAIQEADAVILGPGSLYTSVLPNLLIRDIAKAIQDTSAVKAYVCNIMTQPGETDGYSAAEHVQSIIQHVGPGVIDYAIVNVEEIPKRMLRRYKDEGAYPVIPDIARLNKLGVKVAEENLVYETDLVRHHPDKLSRAIVGLIFRLKSETERDRFLDAYMIGERAR